MGLFDLSKKKKPFKSGDTFQLMKEHNVKLPFTATDFRSTKELPTHLKMKNGRKLKSKKL